MRACSSAALRAFSIASFMKLAAWEGATDEAPPVALPRSRENGDDSNCDCGVERGNGYS